MEVSRNWLQNFFSAPLPDAEVLADSLTFHSFEIESLEKHEGDDILDVKITPNRGHDGLSHRAIAKELSAVLRMPLSVDKDPFSKKPDLSKKTNAVTVVVENTTLCKRYIAAYVTGVKVGPSPEWLRRSLESIGQRSINNIVDATNMVMFNTGQPLHAFDAGKLSAKNGTYSIAVRSAKKGEKMLALDDKEYALSPSILAIVDANADEVIGIAGVKGGMPTGVDESTKSIILEAANFDGVSVRRTATALKLRTDASDRFQQVISPEIAAYGMQQVVDLIVTIAGGKIEGFIDVYPEPQKPWTVSVSTAKVNAVLGTQLADADVADAFSRLQLPFTRSGEDFVVAVPFERLDIVAPEDLIEELARIIGYDKIAGVELPPAKTIPAINKRFVAAERLREKLMSEGYSEVLTSAFVEKGTRVVANKVDGVRPYLRSTLLNGLEDALERNIHNKELLGLKEIKLFEIGTVWQKGKEIVVVGTVGEKEKPSEVPLEEIDANAYDPLPLSPAEHYQPFSRYPSIVRDIALWVEGATRPEEVLTVIRDSAGTLLVRSEKFDEFKKGNKVSFAFRLVFQSFEKTLTDEEANETMKKVYAAVKTKGWEVR
jgi:phenylalanyl-tRNA synthetase beta chain